MRLTQYLLKQHIGRAIKRHWYIQNKQVLKDLNSRFYLEQENIKVTDPVEEIFRCRKPTPYDFSILQNVRPLPLKEPPPRHGRIIYTSSDNDLLVLGVSQAQVITKTVIVGEKLPERVEALIENCPEEIEKIVQRIIRNCTIFNAHQEKLPKRKDPAKPAWNFSRDYGIPPIKQIRDMSNKFVRLCDLITGPDLANDRKIVHDGIVSFPFEKDSDGFQFRMTLDLMVTSNSPLKPFCDRSAYNFSEVPSLHPVYHTVSLVEQEAYELEDIYPINPKSNFSNMHTIFAHFDPFTVKNLTELPVQNMQFCGRSLIKAFTAAASLAKQKFGPDLKNLPEPISVQCIHSDGRTFHFTVFQLNTLDLNGSDGVKNYWWSLPTMELYKTAGYENGIPILQGYNPEVFKTLLAFYKNS